MLKIVIAALVVAIGMVPAYAEILHLEPLYNQYSIGSAVTINGQSTSPTVFVKIVDPFWNTVEVAELQANGQFIGTFLITPITWEKGVYTVLVTDGNKTITNNFEVVEGKLGKARALHFWPGDIVVDEIIVQPAPQIVNATIEPTPQNNTSTLNETTTIIEPIAPNVTSNHNVTDDYTKQLEIENAALKEQVANLKAIILEQIHIITNFVLGH